MTPLPGKTFESNCDECRKIEKEFHNQDMELFLSRNEEMIKKHFQLHGDVVKDISEIKKDLRWLKPIVVTLAMAIIILSIYLKSVL